MEEEEDIELSDLLSEFTDLDFAGDQNVQNYSSARKTKIMCTLSQANGSDQALEEMLISGMNAARINMAYCTNTEKTIDIIGRLRAIASKLGKTCPICIDLKGPSLRTRSFKSPKGVELKRGDTFRLTTNRYVEGDSSIIAVDYSALPNKVGIGSKIHMNYGKVVLKVVGFENETQYLSRMGINISKGVAITSFPRNSKSFLGLLPTETEEDNFLSPLTTSVKPVEESKTFPHSDQPSHTQTGLKQQKADYIYQSIVMDPSQLVRSASGLSTINPSGIAGPLGQFGVWKENPLPRASVASFAQTPIYSLEIIKEEECFKPGQYQRKMSLHSPDEKEAQKKRTSYISKPKGKLIIICEVESGGHLSGGNIPLFLPNISLKQDLELSVISVKDIKDIHLAVNVHADIITVTQIENKDDIEEVRELLGEAKSEIKIFSKIQNRNALKNIEEILEYSDGIVIARGYLGLDLKFEHVVYVQEHLIKKCRLANKPVFLSTDIMESMVTRLRPRRSEVVDISTAIVQGIDCFILSRETAKGPFYTEVVDTLSAICKETEFNINYIENYEQLSRLQKYYKKQTVEESICSCAIKICFELPIALIISISIRGKTALILSKMSPPCPVIVITLSDLCMNYCSIIKGIYPYYLPSLQGLTAEILVEKVVDYVKEKQIVCKGSKVVFTSGLHEELSGTSTFRILDIPSSTDYNKTNMQHI